MPKMEPGGPAPTGEADEPASLNFEQLAEAIKTLPREEAALLLFKLEISLKKRKVMLLGYFVALLVWAAGMLGALVYYGMSTGFVGWAFLMPFALVGVILFAFGKWANKIAATKPPPELVVKR